MINKKKCVTCNLEKDINKFQKGRSTCRRCWYLKYKKEDYWAKYRRENLELMRETSTKWSAENKPRILEYTRKRYREDPQYKLRSVLRSRIYSGLKSAKKLNSSSELLGCTWKECKDYIETLWEEGMSWDNHNAEGWHIDHIRPIASFDLRRRSEQLACFNYKNLQPMWGTINLSKGARWKIRLKK